MTTVYVAPRVQTKYTLGAATRVGEIHRHPLSKHFFIASNITSEFVTDLKDTWIILSFDAKVCVQKFNPLMQLVRSV